MDYNSERMKEIIELQQETIRTLTKAVDALKAALDRTAYPAWTWANGTNYPTIQTTPSVMPHYTPTYTTCENKPFVTTGLLTAKTGSAKGTTSGCLPPS